MIIFSVLALGFIKLMLGSISTKLKRIESRSFSQIFQPIQVFYLENIFFFSFSIDDNSIVCGMFLQVKFKIFRNVKIKNRGGKAGKRRDLKEREKNYKKEKAGLG